MKKIHTNQAPKCLHKGEILSLPLSFTKVCEGVKKLTKRLDVLKKPAPLLKVRIKFLRNRDIMSAVIN
jgi:hypothetical protein